MARMILMVLIAVGLLISFPLSFMAYRRFYKKTKWIKHIGTVIDHVADDENNVQVRYTYVYQGTSAEGISAWASLSYRVAYPLGSSVGIYIDPNDHTNSDIQNPFYPYFHLMAFAFGAAFWGLGIYGLIEGWEMGYE